MPNKNYLAGRRFEYDCIKRWKKQGYVAMRTSGSHGPADVIAIRIDRKPEFVQCKVTSSESQSKRLLKSFRETTLPSSFYHQVLEVKIKGSTKIKSTTI